MSKGQGTISYITSQIEYACKTFKNRTGGSESERLAQEHFSEELSKWSDSVVQEEYKLHPQAFIGWLVPAGLLCLASVALYWTGIKTYNQLYTLFAMLCVVAVLLVYVLEFVLYRKFIDFAWPRRTSKNVFATVKPEGDVKQRIVFCGHADAAYEFTYILNRSKKRVFIVIAGNTVGMLYMLLLSAAQLITSFISGPSANTLLWSRLGVLGMCFLPFFAALIFFVNLSKVVDGANDNLSGCLVAMSVLRSLKRTGPMKHTEVCCLLTGGEEEGLRGAMSFARKHKHDFDDVETIFVALDTLREVDQIKIYNRGMNGTVYNSEYVGDLLREAGKSCGLDIPDAGTYPGATDADALSREGLTASGLGGVDHLPQTYYHTRHDTYTNIDEHCIKLTYDICMSAVDIYDRRAVDSERERTAHVAAGGR